MTKPTNVKADEQPDGQDSVPEIVTEEKPDQPSEENVTEDAKKTEEEAEASEEAVETEEEAPEEKPDPFHKNPRFKKLTRDNRSLKKGMSKALDLIEKQNQKLEQFMAEQKGEEYVPPKEEKNYDSLWDDLDEKLEVLGKEENLTDEQIEEIHDLADEYGEDTKSGKIPLRADIAYKLFKKLGSAKPAEKKAPDTKPTKKADEKKVSKTTVEHPKFRNPEEMYSHLKREAEQFFKMT